MWQTRKKIYGEVDPAYEYTVYEMLLVVDETAGGITQKYELLIGVDVTGKPGRTEGENAGTYDLSLEQDSTLSAGSNYEIQWKGEEAPKLTIKPKPIGDDEYNPETRIGASIGYMEAKADAVWPKPSVIYWAATQSMTLNESTDYTVTYYKKGEETPITAPRQRMMVLVNIMR